MKKILSILLTMVLIISIIPLGVFDIDANAETDGYYTYTISNGEATITDVDNSISGDINIPPTLGEYPTVKISENAFRGCENITSVVIPLGVVSIGKTAFYECKGIISVDIPDSVVEIGRSAFNTCSSLTTVTLPNSIKNIGNSAFYQCKSLTNINIPAGLTSIGKGVFSYCGNLTSIIIPDGVTSIGENTFSHCYNLTDITIPNTLTSVGDKAFEKCEGIINVWYIGCEKIKSKLTIGANNDSFKKAIWNYSDNYSSDCDTSCNFCGFIRSTSVSHSYDNGCDIICDNCGDTRYIEYYKNQNSITIKKFDPLLNGDLIIPSEIDGCPVVRISSWAFNGCDNIKSITLPDAIVNVVGETFYGCSGLTDIIVSENSVNYSSLDGVLFNKDTTTLIKYPAGKTDVYYKIPDGVTSIGERAFQNCLDIIHIEIPKSVVSLALYALGNCKNIHITDLSAWCSMYIYATSDPATSYCAYLEHDLYLNDELVEELVIPDDVTNIGNYAFSSCHSIKSVVISKNVKQMGISAFFGCRNLKKIVLETKEGWEVHAWWAFYNLENLSDVFYVGTKNDKDKYFNNFLTNYQILWHYNTCYNDEHFYLSECDVQCDNCDWTHKPLENHTYDGVCDGTCNGCGETRNVPDHVYDNQYDLECNECGYNRPYTSGDINNDGKINNKDLGLLMQYLNSWDVEIVESAADINADGKVNNKDYGLLMQYLNGWDVQLMHNA